MLFVYVKDVLLPKCQVTDSLSRGCYYCSQCLHSCIPITTL